MRLAVEAAQNGGIITFRDEAGPQKRVYEFSGNDLNGLAEMLYDIMDLNGLAGDRHDEVRVMVRIGHGDRFQHEGGAVCDLCEGQPR